MTLVRISRELAIDPDHLAITALVTAKAEDGSPVATHLLLMMDDGSSHKVRHAPGELDGVDVHALLTLLEDQP